MRFIFMILLSFGLAGCASTPVYNPMQSSISQEVLLNESSFKAVQDGMSMDAVHQLMGQELVIGYRAQTPGYKPLTIPNPYRTEEIKDKGYLIEYYVQQIRQPDGIVSDDELLPLIFKDGKLIGRGWPLANSIRPAH